MKPFSYERATSSAEAAEAAGRCSDAKFIAGGTNLLDLMKLQIEAPAHLIDVNHIGLDAIEELPDGGVRIGGLVRNADLAADPKIRRHYAVLSRALLAGGSGQIRNRATVAGNLLQRTRCTYFYERGLPCNKRAPGSGCSAILGISRGLAVLGTSDACIATNPSDMAVAMRALDATVHTVRPDGNLRAIPIAELHRLPGESPEVETNLGHGELITAVTLPPPLAGLHLYRKVRDRASFTFATVSMAAVLTRSGARITHGRLAFGGLAHKPWRVEAAEVEIPAGPAAVADVLLEGARATTHNAFKLTLVRRMLEATLVETGNTGL